MEINEIDIILFDTHFGEHMIHPKDLTISVWHVKSQASQMFVEQNFLPNLKIKYPHYCPFVKRNHRSHVKSHHKGPVIRKGFKFISPTCYVSYLNNLYIYYVCCCVVRTVTWLPMWSKMADVYLDGTPSRMSWTQNRHVPDCICAMVNTAIIYLFHGLLSVRYVALYDRIERKCHVFVQKCKRFIGENINKHFPWKMPGRCPGTSFFKNNVPCATEGRSTLFIFLSKYSIS